MLWLYASLLLAEPAKNKVYTSTFGYETVFVEHAAFEMGTVQGDIDESIHHVELTRSFFIGRTEVTVEFWKKVMGTAPWTQPQTNCRRNGIEEMPEHHSPVYCVDWNEAAFFANILSDWERLEQCYLFEGEQVIYSKGTECLGYRLPTEAEWEFAAQSAPKAKDAKVANPKDEDAKVANPKDEDVQAADSKDKESSSTPQKQYTYSGGDEIRLVGWYQGNSDNLAQRVALLKPNERGIYDLSGNLWEWCHDWYGSYEQLQNKDPTGSSHGVYRVLRGGSFASPTQDTRIHNRFRRFPTYRSNQIGFRLARTAPPKGKKENRDKK